MKIRVVLCLFAAAAMRLSFFGFGFFIAALGLHAGQQTYTVTPYSLAGWTLVGAELPAILGQAELTLPANAQLVRSVVANEIALQAVSRPLIGEAAGDWPVWELGDAALVFHRHEDSGRLLLVLGDQPPQELAFTFALDAEGRSLAPLAVGFARDNAEVRVTLNGLTQTFPASAISDTMSDIVVSAGDTQPWAFQRLEVTVVAADPVAAPKTAVAGPFAPAQVGSENFPAGRPPVGGGPVASFSFGQQGMPPRPEAPAGGQTPVSATVARRSGLEVYTPSSVRHGRTKMVRAAVQAKSQN